MADLVVDTDLVEETASNLDIVAREFDDADRYAQTVADAVGDDTLAGAITAFAHDWSERRSTLQESIANLAELTAAVASEFRSLDRDLAASLEENQ
ncbi:hypothetical protein [Isoptericola sp. BMS4]|uniref:hypothetical protein n=1 Tax=Isoptericola sp. BMS4 TaxID=2527875 RepID=UPI001421A0B3|nr:hypothetical protein [Isoptericola sp. BMS4]